MNLDNKTIVLIKTWGIAALLFMLIALVSIYSIFTPVKYFTEYYDGTILEESHPPLDIIGGWSIARSWTKYPNYAIGLGIAAGVSFAGMAFCIIRIESKRRADDEKNEDKIVDGGGR